MPIKRQHLVRNSCFAKFVEQASSLAHFRPSQRGRWLDELFAGGALIVLLSFLPLGLGGCYRQGKSFPDEVEIQPLGRLQPQTGGEMVLIPPGTFIMGDAQGRPEETPHEVSLHSFYLDCYPVTQEVFEQVMAYNPSQRKEPKNPVERTQWTDAVRFCNKCSELEGLTPCYDLKTWTGNLKANGYRLPTEAEWEYACRAGSQTRYFFGDNEADLPRFAWFKPHSEGTPHPVGQKRPNRWGLFDMHGNVWQWCHDFYGENYYRESPRENPTGPVQGQMRLLRGGAWDCPPDKCRAAYRFKECPVYSDACFGADSYGFRRARNAGQGDKEIRRQGDKETRRQGDTQSQKDIEKPTAKAASSGETVAGSRKIDLARLRGTIVFVSNRSGTLKIWRMHASGKDPKQLTHDANPDADPRFSPDGKRISYTTLRGGFPEIWTMKRDGSEARFVTKGAQGSWSPGGKAMVFIRDNQAFVRNLETGRERRVTPEKWERCGVPAWSPDGKRLAVASRHLGNIGIFLLSPEGKEHGQLQAPEPCCTPQWSRDGQKILCQTVQGHICQVNVDGRNWDQLTFGADLQHDGRYSPDGSLVLFCRAPTPQGPWQICVQELDGDETSFVPLTREGSNLLPDWHPEE